MGFFRQEYWSGLPFLPLGDLPDSGIKPVFPALQAGSLPLRQRKTPTAKAYLTLNGSSTMVEMLCFI